ncbi:MAG TPA: response regulator transcription factor [Candidatus Polarisedimenticolaceae bacterium]|nr:response regulator transcription factor [Candidatus Polarisedimenticolaceae bacterium]
MKRILIIEDNADLAFGLRNNFELEGYEVRVAGDGPAGLAALADAEADLVVLDLMLPEMNGFDVLEQIRRRGSVVPVLILTARGEESDKVTGLRLGADDYLTKPFGLMELLARVEALLRRSTATGEGRSRTKAILKFGAIEVDPATRTVTRDAAVVHLAPKEFDLLVALIRHDGAVVSREELLDEVWGYASDVASRTVDTHIAELRRKLEHDPSMPRHLLTVRKAGYRLAR